MGYKEYLYRNIAFRIVDFFRKSNALHIYDEIRYNSRLSRELLVKMQRDRLRDLLIHCHRNVPYYKRLFKHYEVDPYKEESFEELARLPILSKEIIRENFDELKANNFSDYIPRLKSTSGSTGQPLNFYWDKRTHGYTWANIWRCWEEAGYTLGEEFATLSGGALLPEKVSFKDKVYQYLNHAIHLPTYHLTSSIMERYVRIIKIKKPKVMYGYPSAIWEFSKFLEKRGENIRFRSVITTSEMLLKQQREDIERILHCRVYDEYGTNDAGILSYECRMHNGYHYNMESAYVEITDENGKPLNYGEIGQVVSTNLVCYAMPFLRYTPGDLAALSDESCPCGNNLIKIINVEGRDRDFIINREGRKIHGAFFNHFQPFYKSQSIGRFQIIQKREGEIDVLLVPKGKVIDPKEVEDIFLHMKRGLDPMDIKINEVRDVIYTKTGKFRIIHREI